MKLKDKITLLKSQLNDFNKNLIESQAEYNLLVSYTDLTNYTNNPQEKLAISGRLDKDKWFSYLELLRSKINIVRTLSPDSANYLDRRVQPYDSIIRNYLTNFNDFVSNPSMEKTVILRNDIDKMSQLNDIHAMIQLCKNCISDVIKQFEECTSSE